MSAPEREAPVGNAPQRKVNAAAIALIKHQEGLRLKSYLCKAGKWTVGWGSTKGVVEGLTITLAEAQRRFDVDVADHASGAEMLSPKWLNDNQFGALVSFAFNFGVAALANSRVLRMLRADPPDLKGFPAEYEKWIHAFDKKTQAYVVLDDLVQRRADELKLFNTPVEPPRGHV